MKTLLKIFLMLIILCAVNVASAEGIDADTKKFLDNEFANMISGKDSVQMPGLGVIVFKDGQKVYSGFFGKRNLEKNLPVTADTRFRVASVSKMFTTFAILQLVEQGKIDLDEDVSKYLGFKLRNPNFPNTPITVRMLASHTSTIRDGSNYGIAPVYGIEEFFKPGGTAYEGGKHFSTNDKNYFNYCNLNYGVLATIVERVSGERFDQYQKKHVFAPMQINADYIVGNLGAAEFKNLGATYKKNSYGGWDARIDNDSVQPARNMVWGQYDLRYYKVGKNATFFAPQGGLRISFEELGNCLEMLINGGNFRGKQIVREDLLNEMCKKQWIYDSEAKNGTLSDIFFNYGLGVYQIDGDSPARLCKDFDIDLIGHGGIAYGLISGVYFRPGLKDGVIFMTNGTAFGAGGEQNSHGKFSNNMIWEEKIMNPICERIFNAKKSKGDKVELFDFTIK